MSFAPALARVSLHPDRVIYCETWNDREVLPAIEEGCGTAFSRPWSVRSRGCRSRHRGTSDAIARRSDVRKLSRNLQHSIRCSSKNFSATCRSKRSTNGHNCNAWFDQVGRGKARLPNTFAGQDKSHLPFTGRAWHSTPPQRNVRSTSCLGNRFFRTRTGTGLFRTTGPPPETCFPITWTIRDR